MPLQTFTLLLSFEQVTAVGVVVRFGMVVVFFGAGPELDFRRGAAGGAAGIVIFVIVMASRTLVVL